MVFPSATIGQLVFSLATIGQSVFYLATIRQLVFLLATSRKSIFPKGNNCSVLKGTSTHNPIITLQQISETATTEANKEAWIVLQDMKKAYDSVSWQGLEASLRRIKMNEKYIKLLSNLHNNRKSTIITSHGFTDEYEIQDGLDQGETHASILWRIFYDPLLTRINKMTKETGFTFKHPVDLEENETVAPFETTINVNHLAFVDDTAWIARSQSKMQAILDIADSFFTTNDITINTEKTETIHLYAGNTKSYHENLRLSNNNLPLPCRGAAHRYLGIWIDGRGSTAATKTRILNEIKLFQNLTRKKPLTDKQVCYIIQAVIHPTIEYRTQGKYLLENETTQVTNSINTIFREKAKLSRETACKTIPHPDIYNITPIPQLQFIARTTETIYDLNSTNIEGKILRARLAQMQHKRMDKTHPTGQTQNNPQQKILQILQQTASRPSHTPV